MDKLLISRVPDPDFIGAARSVFSPAPDSGAARYAQLGREIGDRLMEIKRELDEQIVEVEVKELPDGSFRAAA